MAFKHFRHINPAEYARLQNLGRICTSQYDWNAIAVSDSAAV